MRKTLFFLILFSLLSLPISIRAIDKFYTYYDKGLEYMEKGEWERAIEELKSAISLVFEDAKRQRTYGTRFIKYFPHRELGVCYYYLEEFNDAMGELQLSYAYKKSKRAEEFIKKLSYKGEKIDLSDDLALKDAKLKEQQQLALRQKKLDEQRQKEAEIARKQKELEEEEKRLTLEKKRKEEDENLRLEKEKSAKQEKVNDKELLAEERKRKNEEELLALELAIAIKKKELLEEQTKLEEHKQQTSNVTLLPIGALTYDPSKVTQVGSRLSVAVLNFESNDAAENLIESVTEKLITQLVNLRRFRVIERSALDKIMQEQKLGMTGFVDEETAVKVGKLAGADVIIMGRINLEIGFAKVNARGIDTETSELIVAKEADTGNTNIENIEKLVEQVAVGIYNDLPLVEGVVMAVEEEQVILSIGSQVGVRKGTKCVAYKEGKKYYHPTTGEVLGKNVTPLGELIVVQVQEKMSIAKPLGKISNIEIEDKVVVK
ncbi:MAG: CsgG/HfaB family protein [Candidatus Cloacimonetes bacterium]|nr:CsgG/HfaB family protein [Candidatus Cloacimonadota bacterium]